VDLWRHQSEERSNSSISVLWLQYSSLKLVRDELHHKGRTAAMSELEQIVFETEELEPILREMDSTAMQIASAHGSRPGEISIKAKVLLDYIDMTEEDAVHKLALSLCSAILATPDINRN
jgi:hypothetical protein